MPLTEQERRQRERGERRPQSPPRRECLSIARRGSPGKTSEREAGREWDEGCVLDVVMHAAVFQEGSHRNHRLNRFHR